MKGRRTVVAGLALVGLVVAGVVTAGAVSQRSDGPSLPALRRSGPPSTVGVAPVVTVGAGPVVPWDRPLAVTSVGGRLRSVEAHSAAGEVLPGVTASAGDAWHSTGPLLPATTYDVKVLAENPGQLFEQRHQVTTSEPTAWIRATLSPGDGSVVGIGMPVVVRLDRPVVEADRPAVLQRLSVTPNPPVEGAWRWTSPTEIHWRPASYWQPATTVSARVDLRRLPLSGGVWGADERTTSFTIGEAHVSTVDVASHQMTVTANGQVVRVMPISAGREPWPTKSGLHIVLAKSRVEIMDSSTIGIPRRSSGGYYRKVPWAVRVSNGGTFVHSAPWSLEDQGVRNVSHGCINASPADAEWFFNFSLRGDVVDVVNSPAPPVLWDPGMADWNIPWERWADSSVAAPGIPATNGATG